MSKKVKNPFLRDLLRFAFLIFIGFFLVAQAKAQEYPQRPITVILPTAAGGASDLLTRLWADYASKRLGQAVVVENRPGAGGISASRVVLSKRSDGYTIYSAGSSSLILNRFTNTALPFDTDKDFVGIAMLGRLSFLLVASNGSRIKTIEDLRKIAKERPNGLNFGSAGPGNATHLLMEMVSQQLGIKLTHIPYKGEAAAVAALIADEVQLVAPVTTTALPFTSSGRITPVALIGANRIPELPNVPTLTEAGLGEFSRLSISWAALVARVGTPQQVIHRLHQVTQEFLADPQTQAAFQRIKIEPMPGPTTMYARAMQDDFKMWSGVAKPLNLRNR